MAAVRPVLRKLLLEALVHIRPEAVSLVTALNRGKAVLQLTTHLRTFMPVSSAACQFLLANQLDLAHTSTDQCSDKKCFMTDAQSIPFTRHPASPAKEARVRNSVRQAVSMATEAENSRLAQPDDAAKLHQMLIDPAVHAPIYTLPQPLTVASVRAFIERHLDERERGEGLLFLNLTADGEIAGYTDLQIWPAWAAGELSGAVHPKRQGERRGVLGAQLGFAWMFEALGLELLCETAALDNDRTAKLLDHLGLERMGQTESVKADSTKRASLVWEIGRNDWLDKYPAEEN